LTLDVLGIEDQQRVLFLGLIFLALTQLAPMLKLEVRMFLKLLSPWTGSFSTLLRQEGLATARAKMAPGKPWKGAGRMKYMAAGIIGRPDDVLACLKVTQTDGTEIWCFPHGPFFGEGPTGLRNEDGGLMAIARFANLAAARTWHVLG